MEINVISGALYTQDGKKIADVKAWRYPAE